MFFAAGGEKLLGVLTLPASTTRKAVLIAPGGWYGTSAARNRLLIRMARAIAAREIGCFSFDYHGVGDSTGELPRFQMKNLFTDDLGAAISALSKLGFDEVILVGICYGGRVATTLACTVPGLKGLALVSVPLGKPGDGGGKTAQQAARTNTLQLARRAMSPLVLRGLFDHNMRHSYGRILAAKWRSSRKRLYGGDGSEAAALSSHRMTPQFSDSLAAVLHREIPLLFLYGADDGYYKAFIGSRDEKLGSLLDSARGRVDLVTLQCNVQSFSSVVAQDSVIESVCHWVSDVFEGDEESWLLAEHESLK
jgi:pimeloyl-ACP methyl ester carboxylesterase